MLSIWNQSTCNILSLCVVEGKDATSFLNRISSINVPQMPLLSGHQGFFLSALGKIQSAFVLWKINPDQFFVEVFTPDLKAIDFLNAIEKLHFGEKITYFCKSDWHLTCEITGEITRAAASHQVLIHEPQAFTCSFASALHTLGMKRHWAAQHTLQDSISDQDFDGMRLQAFQPLAPYEFNDKNNPLELGFHSLFIEPKGCYPGQEIIEKIHSRGQPAQRLVLIQGQQLAPQMPLLLEERQVGSITSAQGNRALGMVSKIALNRLNLVQAPLAVIEAIQACAY